MVRAPFYDKNGVKKGAWSREEDDKLKTYVQIYGHSNWRQLPKFAGLARCGKSCRLRWLNYLRPNLKHGNYTPEEEEIIIKFHQQFGNKWSMIAEKLPGRTDNEVKNYWHSHLKKRLKSKEITTSKLKTKPGDSLEENLNETNEFENCENLGANSGENFLHILESSSAMSSETSEGGNYSFTTNAEHGVLPFSYKEFSGDFWSEPFLVEDIDTHQDEICSDEGMILLISNFDGAYLL
ncbi:unnamed protein product [Sphenostylis stenocarpa]|uniref:Uncharacterized protein n=1 Tax=Sphenostylis stenocarpa TaxID=92480 RepID=A0AA87BAY4_9FABA|nr:unnamed protein product [Sphenostylis stenocarpa]